MGRRTTPDPDHRNDPATIDTLHRYCSAWSVKDQPDNILCIGDLGRIPGNDADLLASPYGLSVDQVSCDPKSCWNLAPPGHRGTQAAVNYLTCLVSRREGFFLDMKKLGLKPHL